MRTFQRHLGSLLSVILMAALPCFVACGGDEGDPSPDRPYDETYAGYPEGVERGSPFEDGAWWTEHPNRFALVIWSSNGCPVEPGTVTVLSPTELSVLTLPQPPGTCTSAATAFTYEFETLEGMSTTEPVEITIDDREVVTLVPPAQ